jgi:pilus assembly protein CpaB
MASSSRRTGTILIVVALVLIVALAAVYFLALRPGAPFATALGPQPTATTNPQETALILITTKPIARGATITADSITTLPYPKGQIAEGVFLTDPQQVVGQRAAYPLEAMVPLTASMLIKQEGGSVTAHDIPASMTAFSIPITRETSVDYAVQNGDHVMVTACLLMTQLDPDFQSRLPNNSGQITSPQTPNLTAGITGGGGAVGRLTTDPNTGQPIYQQPSEPNRAGLVCQAVIPDATIMHLGSFTAVATPAPTPGAASVSAGPDSATLLVSPQDALVLNYLLLSGAKLSLALLSTQGTGNVAVNAVNAQTLMESKSIPYPSKLPWGVEPALTQLSYPLFGSPAP